MDFAPPVDLYDGIPGTGLGERCASADPDEVAQAAGAFLEGLESQGVFGCLKHFPGLGSTRVDSHKELPEIMDPAQIERGLRPFRALARPGRLVMVGHVRTPWSEGRPASLHRAHVAGNPWGVQATWVTDDLEMGGVTPWPWPERARWAIEAGHGALLVCQTHEAQLGARAALSELPADLLAPSLDAGRQFRRQLPRPLDGPFDQAAWEAWVPRVRAAAARLA